MHQIRCPRCGEVFQVDESGYAAIVKQVRDSEFAKEVAQRETAFESAKTSAVQLAVAKSEAEKDRHISALQAKLDAAEMDKCAALDRLSAEKEAQISRLESALESGRKEAELAKQAELQTRDAEIQRLRFAVETEKKEAETALQLAVQEKISEIQQLKSELQHDRDDSALRENALREQHLKEIQMKDEQIAQYRDFKARQSTKMIGESLEQHCLTEFNRIRMAAFPHAYFEKDNDARTGSKGDFIYRESSEDGIEFLSIMFEMKNEMDETATKHKNEDFFRELDRDRREKGCEYAVLVTLLEADSELYNGGIVDVSYKYEKMYVVRPQFFIPLITILRNAALNSLQAKRELAVVRNQNIDITHFEEDMEEFKRRFSYNYGQASKRFHEAIEEIDKSIQHLQKIKDALTASDRQLQLANNKAEDLSIKSLTRNNPTMRAKFEELEREDNA